MKRSGLTNKPASVKTTKKGKSVRFDSKMKEINSMSSQSKPAPKKREKNNRKNLMSEPKSADPLDDGHNYGIDRLNLSEPVNN